MATLCMSLQIQPAPQAPLALEESLTQWVWPLFCAHEEAEKGKVWERFYSPAHRGSFRCFCVLYLMCPCVLDDQLPKKWGTCFENLILVVS